MNYLCYCRFTYVDVGAQGRVSNGGVYQNCSLSQALEDNTLDLPAPSHLPGVEGPALPYVILADEAFPLKENIMRRYSRRQLTDEQRVSICIVAKLN